MFSPQNVKAVLGVILCVSLSVDAGAQSASPQGDVHVQELQLSRLVDKKLQPKQIEIIVSLQTSGTVISKLVLSYRAAGAMSFSEVSCSQTADLGYLARLPYYADSVEYFFVATPAVGAEIRLGDGRIIGSDIKGQKPISRPWAPSLVGAIAGAFVFLVTFGVAAGVPSSSSKSVHKDNTRLYVGAALGATTAAVTYLFVRHRRAASSKSQKHPQGDDRVSECHQ